MECKLNLPHNDAVNATTRERNFSLTASSAALHSHFQEHIFHLSLLLLPWSSCRN